MNVFFCPSNPYCSALDIVNDSTGRGRYSRLNLEEMQAKFGDVSIVENTVAVEYDRKRRMTEVREITEERFWEMLEVLPPCKWTRRTDAEAFHISERITHDIVDWFVRIGDKFYNFADSDTISADFAIAKAFNVHTKETA